MAALRVRMPAPVIRLRVPPPATPPRLALAVPRMPVAGAQPRAVVRPPVRVRRPVAPPRPRDWPIVVAPAEQVPSAPVIRMPDRLPEPRVRVVLLASAQPRAVPIPPVIPPPIYATSVGITAGIRTMISMNPASLLVGPETDITAFTIITMDAGTYT